MMAEAPREARRAILRRLSLQDGLHELVPALHVQVADLVVAIRSDDAPALATLVRAFTPFAVARTTAPAARLDLRIDRTPDIWDVGSPEPRAETADGLIWVEHRDFVGLLEPDASHMVVVHPRYVLAVENALRVLVALVLLRNDGLLLHAAGVVRDPGATVLFGRSGSGKTTVTRMARGRAILGDDVVALRRGAEGWNAFSTPFGGELARQRRARSARLNELFRLRHGAAFEVRPIPAARGVAELMQSAILPAALAEDGPLALERCGQLQDEVGVQELSFPLDNGLWRWLDGRTG
jgi:hypothetical protein